jgi:hypothetical protein
VDYKHNDMTPSGLALTADDRIEIFMQVLTGSSDLTQECLDQLLSDYSVGGLEVAEC